LERTIDAKWTIDEQRGQGFVYEDTIETGQLGIFSETKPKVLKSRLEDLEKTMWSYVNENPNCNNCDIYEFILLNDFRPTHAKQILTKWQKDSLLRVWDVEKNKEARKGSFYLGYDYFKIKNEKVTFKII
jgi:hypothetical protein